MGKSRPRKNNQNARIYLRTTLPFNNHSYTVHYYVHSQISLFYLNITHVTFAPWAIVKRPFSGGPLSVAYCGLSARLLAALALVYTASGAAFFARKNGLNRQATHASRTLNQILTVRLSIHGYRCPQTTCSGLETIFWSGIILEFMVLGLLNNVSVGHFNDTVMRVFTEKRPWDVLQVRTYINIFL